MKETFGQWLRRTREYAGLTRLQLDRRAGITNGYTKRYEEGTTKPTLTALERICDALDVDYVVGAKEE